MNELIDNGKILEVRRFLVTPHDNLPTVFSSTHSELFKLCSDFISGLYSDGENFLKEKLVASETEVWKGKARLIKELDAL